MDARRFVALAREARTRAAAEPDAAVQLFEEALAPWHGDPYPSLSSPTLEAVATRLAEIRLGAVTQMWEIRLARGEHADAIADLEQLTRLCPLRKK